MPSIAITQPYEAVYIVDSTLGDEQIAVITAKYKGIIEAEGGTVGKIDIWERRKLAYEVKGRTEGIYVIMQFQSKPAVEAELRRVFQISEDQIRFLIVRQDEAETALPAAAAPAAVEAAPVETAPLAEAPAAETPVETPAAEAPASEAPVAEEPAAEEPAAEVPDEEPAAETAPEPVAA